MQTRIATRHALLTRNAVALAIAVVFVLAVWFLLPHGTEALPATAPSASPDTVADAAHAVTQSVTPPIAPLPGESDRIPGVSAESAHESDARPLVADDAITVSAIAVDEAGRPLATTRLEWSVVPITISVDGAERVAGAGPEGSTTTDEAGSFQFRVSRLAEREVGFHELVVSTSGERGRCEFRCPASARCELGVITIAGPPVLVAGIVVDLAGKPIPGVQFRLKDRSHELGSDIARTGLLPTGRTGDDGRFALRGHSRARTLTLWASHDRYALEVRESMPVPVEDLRIVMTPATAPYVRVRLVRDAGDCSEGLVVWLHHPQLQQARFWLPRIDADSWELRRLVPGQCSVEVTACGTRLAYFEGVDVPPDGPSLDPRIDAVDLRGRLECVRVHVVTRSGQPIPQGTFSIGDWTVVADEKGVVALARPIGARIFAADCNGAQVELVDGVQFCVAS